MLFGRRGFLFSKPGKIEGPGKEYPPKEAVGPDIYLINVEESKINVEFTKTSKHLKSFCLTFKKPVWEKSGKNSSYRFPQNEMY